MKNILKPLSLLFSLLAVASISFYSCTPAASDAPAEVAASSRIYHVSENDSSNIALATEYLNSLVMGDGSVAQSMVSESFMSYGPAEGDSATIDEVVAQWAANAASRTNQQAGIFISNGLTVTEGPVTGDWAIMWGTYTANDTKSGVDVTVPWNSVTKIEDGKIVQVRAWFDNLAPSMAVGAVVPAK